MFTSGQNLTFVAADPPRHSWFACWDPADPGGLLTADDGRTDSVDRVDRVDGVGADRVDIELALAANRGTARAVVSVRPLPMAAAIDVLAPIAATDDVSPSVHAWAAGVREALRLISSGQVLPWVSPAGFDTWRADPQGPREIEHVAMMAAAMPAAAHAVVAPGRGRIASAEFTLRAMFDATADAFLRTAAAHRVGSLTLFADPRPTKAPQLRPWVNDLANAHCASAQLVLRVHPPDDHASGGRENHWRIVFQLQSRVDPSLLINASDLWDTPAEVLNRMGDQAEVTLLAGLRRVSDLVSPLRGVLDHAAPTETFLHDDDLDELLDRLDDLADAHIDVRWPAELVAPRLARQLVVSSDDDAGAPGSAIPSVNALESLLRVDWEFLLDGVPLTREELEVLGEAKRAVVPLRGKWVRLGRADRDRLKARVPAISATLALALALGADLDLADEHDAEPVEVRVEGAVAALARRLTDVAGNREELEPPGLKATLRPYQRRGLAWMADLCALGLGGCLADDMGLGKTVQLLALHQLRGGPTLVVCPTSLLHNGEREAGRFVPETRVVTYHGARREVRSPLAEVGPGDLVLTTYGVVRSDAEALSAVPWDLVVADEAQFAKNPRSRTARALREIPGTARIALTGTPVENRLSELWSILDWAVPGLLGPLATFRRQTATPIERDNDQRAAQRLNQLVQPFLLRRRKSDPGIAPDLPPKIERDVVVPLSAEQVTLYKATVETALAEVANADGIERRGLVLKLLTGLKQITNHPAHFLGEGGPLDRRSGKLDALEELLAEARLQGESTLIFSQYVKMGELLVEHFANAGHRIAMLHGGLSVTGRQALVDQFQNGELDVLILSLKAGGTGLNLTAAANVVHYDRWWNPAVEDQATDRAYRIGQNQTVTVHRIITEGTVEDRVAELLRVKRELAERVIGSGDRWIGDLSNEDLSDLVRLGAA